MFHRIHVLLLGLMPALMLGCHESGWAKKIKELGYIPEPIPDAVASPAAKLGRVYRLTNPKSKAFGRVRVTDKTPVVGAPSREIVLSNSYVDFSFRESKTLALDLSPFALTALYGPADPVPTPTRGQEDAVTITRDSLNINEPASLRAATYIDGTIWCVQPEITEAELRQALSEPDIHQIKECAIRRPHEPLVFVSRVLYARRFEFKGGGGIAFRINDPRAGLTLQTVNGKSEHIVGKLDEGSQGGFVLGVQYGEVAVDTWIVPEHGMGGVVPPMRDSEEWNLLKEEALSTDAGTEHLRLYVSAHPLGTSALLRRLR